MNMNNLKMLAKALVLSLGFCVAAASCDQYDDTDIWNAVNDLRDKVEALENLITVVKDSDGNYYWAVYRDGKAEMLLVNGSQVPVAVMPAIKLSENKEWLISVDGGKTWLNTGIYDESEEGPEVEMFFTDVKIEEGHLVMTLTDGTVVKLPVAGGDAVFSSDVDSLWFSRTSMTKSAAIDMNNVKSYTITEKPEGWKAYIEESYLYVTSPEDPAASSASDGSVKVLALFEGGAQPDILSIYVGYEPMVSLFLENDSIVVEMSEHTAEDFTGYILTAWPESDFTPELAVAWLNSDGAQSVPYSGGASYEITDLVTDYSAKEAYVVFAVPYLPANQVAQGALTYVVEDLQTLHFADRTKVWAFSDISYDYAHLNASFSDVTEYYGGFYDKVSWDNGASETVFESLKYGRIQPCMNLTYDGPASAFPFNEQPMDLLPSTEYLVWMLPVRKDGKYSTADFITRTFVTPAVTKDASIPAPTATIDEVTFSGFTATVTPAAGAYKTYSAIRPSSVIPVDELESVEDLMAFRNYSKGEEKNTVSTSDYDSDTELYLVSVSVTEDGRYGELLKQKVELKTLKFSEELSIAVTGIENGLGDVTLSLEFTGNPVSITYYAETYCFYDDATLQRFLALGQLYEARTVQVSALKDGKLNISGLEVGAVYMFYAIVKDADGVSSYLYKYDFTPKVEVDYIVSTDADYQYGMPVLSGRWSGKQYVLNAEKPDECEKFWLLQGDTEYMTGDPWTDTDKLLTGFFAEATVHTSSVKNKRYSWMYDESRFYIAWLDDQGRYHAVHEFNPHQ